MSREFVEFFTQLVVIPFGVTAGGLISFKLLWPKVESYNLRLHVINQNRSADKAFQQLRFAAYERLLLLVHRMSPEEIMLRNHRDGSEVHYFIKTLVQDVESEYQHNLAQQLYVSDVAWQYVTDLKNNTIRLLRNVGETLSADASLDQYIAAVLKHLRAVEDDPYLSVQRLLKQDMIVK